MNQRENPYEAITIGLIGLAGATVLLLMVVLFGDALKARFGHVYNCPAGRPVSLHRSLHSTASSSIAATAEQLQQ